MKPFAVFSMLFLAGGVLLAGAKVKLTILYDNTVHTKGTRSDWGFACLVENGQDVLLFDTGTHPHILAANAKKLGVDLGAVRRVVISHGHRDHFGGLPAVLRVMPKGVEVYIPPNLPETMRREIAASGGKAIPATDPVTLGKGMQTTGILGDAIPEQGLIVTAGERHILITGCAHPGITAMVRRARDVAGTKMDVVLGGFHLSGHSATAVERIIAEFKALGVGRAGATHCTGAKAIAAFREAYGDDFLEMGVGRVLEFE